MLFCPHLIRFLTLCCMFMMVDSEAIPGDCNFNSGLCTWSNDDHDTMEWILHRGPTTTAGTGPLSDHTSIDIPGNLKAGKYIYIESSGKKQGDYARLISETFHNKANRCLTFWYHMYGKPGSLRVGVITNQSQPVTLFNITGDHGNNWLEGSVYIPDTFREFQVVFDGIRGSSYLGDIALDDIKFTGNCNETDTMFTTTTTAKTTEKLTTLPPPETTVSTAKHSSLDATTYKTTYPLTTISSLETTTAAKATSPEDTTSSPLETTTAAKATSVDETTTLSDLETTTAAQATSPDDTTISSLLETTTSPDDKTTYKTHRVTTEQLISTIETMIFTHPMKMTCIEIINSPFKCKY